MTAVPCSEADAATRRAIVAEATRWIGTPYCHQASLAGAGADCLGLVRGVWRAVYGHEPEAPPAYSSDWAETRGGERLLAAARRHLIEIVPSRAGEGDVLVFRMRAAGPAKHLAILATPWLEPGRIIHAYSGAEVCLTHLTPSWTRRIAGAFRFPAPIDRKVG